MLSKVAIVYGSVFTALGLLGFIPALAPTTQDGMGMLFGLFMVDGLHNFIHLTSGLVGLAAARTIGYSRLYLQFIGVIYALVAVLGFMTNPVLGILATNMADNWLHVLIAVGAIYYGFVYRDHQIAATA